MSGSPRPLLVLVQPPPDPGFPAVPFRIEPLSLIALAAQTPPSWRVRILDGALRGLARLIDPRADLVGITVVTATSRGAFAVADAYRRRGVRVVLGGPGVLLDPATAARHADSLVLGEVEGRWSEVLADARAGRLLPVYRFGAVAAYRLDPAAMAAARAAIPHYRRHYPLVSVVQATRGCPHACPFCAPAVTYGQRLRHRPVDEVVAEIRLLRRRFGRRMIGFTDDNLAGDRVWLRALLTAIRPLGIRWSGQSCLELAEDEDLLDLVAASGCMSLMIGLEAVDQASLAAAGKGHQDVARNAVLLGRLQARGIMVIGTYTIGHDADDEGVYDRVLAACRAQRIDFPLFMTLMVHPGLPLYARLAAEGRLRADPAGIHPFRAAFLPAGLDAARLPARLADLYARAYDWRYILGNLWHWLRRGRLARVLNLIGFYCAYFTFVRRAARSCR